MGKVTRLVASLSLIVIPVLASADARLEQTRWVGDYLYVMVGTTDEHLVKCIIFDANGKPVRVARALVTPPYDEVVIHIGKDHDIAKTANCYQE